MNAKITILGCGGSEGVPSLTTGYRNCDASNPYNKRLRSSIVISLESGDILIDSGPDLRQQLLKYGFAKNIKSVLYTHSHRDHIAGMDELRSINRLQQKYLNCYMSESAIEDIKASFKYAFSLTDKMVKERGIFAPWLHAHTITCLKDFNVQGLSVCATEQNHGYSTSVGFIFNKKFAYLTDFKELDEKYHHLYTNLHTLIIAAGAKNTHPCHSSLSETIELIKKLKPKQAFLTHLDNTLDYNEITEAVKGLNIKPCYDGLQIQTEL